MCVYIYIYIHTHTHAHVHTRRAPPIAANEPRAGRACASPRQYSPNNHINDNTYSISSMITKYILHIFSK